MQGATALSETLAQYSALMVMEKTYGQAGIRKFLKYELDRYLRVARRRTGRGTAADPGREPALHPLPQGLAGHVPAARPDRRGQRSTRALRRLLAQYAFKGAPYPRSQDLVDALRAEAGADPVAQQLITDLFEKITVYDLSTQRAVARRRADGRYDVTLTLEAKKAYADCKGLERETPIPAGEVFDIGVFAAEPGKPAFGEQGRAGVPAAAAEKRRPDRDLHCRPGPAFAGVDPYNKQIDRNSDDNAIRVIRN